MAQKDNYAALSGVEKAAIVLMSLNESNAGKIFNLLHEDEIKEISQIMSTLGTVSPEVVERLFFDFSNALSETLNFVGNIYYHRWIIEEGESEPEDRNWLANDIIRYISRGDIRAAWLCQDFILRRLFLINDLLQSQRYGYVLDKMSAEQELRRYWGLMLPKERHEMIDQFVMGWS